MSDENPNPQPDISAQFRELGENIKNFFQSAWESEESQKFRQELQNGLNELGRATNETVEEFKNSETGKKFKAEADDFIQRVEAGQVEDKARQEISKVLDFINAELGNLNEKIKPKPAAAPPPETAGAQEEPISEDEG
jgi:transketolase